MAAEVTARTDHPEWGDEVLRNKDDSVMHPLEINFFLACLLGLFCFFGFPLNFEIIIRILYDKTMRLKPRYIIQLAIAFSGILLLFTNVVIIFDFCFGPSEIVCNIFVSFFMGVPYNCFLFNYFLSFIDCFCAIVFPLWHFTKLTPRRVVCGLIGLNLAMALAMKWQFISEILKVQCAFELNHGIVINGTSSVLFVLCLVFCCIDFAITWFHLPRSSSRTITVPVNITVNPTAVVVEEIEMQPLGVSLFNIQIAFLINRLFPFLPPLSVSDLNCWYWTSSI